MNALDYLHPTEWLILRIEVTCSTCIAIACQFYKSTIIHLVQKRKTNSSLSFWRTKYKVESFTCSACSNTWVCSVSLRLRFWSFFSSLACLLCIFTTSRRPISPGHRKMSSATMNLGANDLQSTSIIRCQTVSKMLNLESRVVCYRKIMDFVELMANLWSASYVRFRRGFRQTALYKFVEQYRPWYYGIF